MQRALAVHPRGQWPEDRTVDTVTLAYLDRHRRRIRLVADSGTAFLLDLPRAQHIEAADRESLLRIAWHLGNRHLPLQVAGDRLRIREDHVIAEMVSGLGGQITRREAPFDPEFGAYAAGAAHSHHPHNADGGEA